MENSCVYSNFLFKEFVQYIKQTKQLCKKLAVIFDIEIALLVESMCNFSQEQQTVMLSVGCTYRTYSCCTKLQQCMTVNPCEHLYSC